MDISQALILGVVEGVTEFLPVSSTGHLILAAKMLGLAPTEFIKSFEIAIQLGAILAVVVLYWRALLLDREILKRLAVAFAPTAVIGFVLYKVIKKFLLGSDHVVVWSLLLGGIFLIVFELLHKEKKDALDDLKTLPYRTAFLIGVCQSLAVIPGVSRAAATIIGGLCLGLKRRAVVEFSFLLAVPTMLAATALDLMKSASSFSASDFHLLAVGFAAAFVVAMASVKFLLYYIRTNNFMAFGIYRAVIAIVCWPKG